MTVWGFEKHPTKGVILHRRCKKCKSADRPYYSKGYCAPCYETTRRKYKAEYWMKHYSKTI